MGLIQEAMDKRQLGLPNPRLPPSEAKTRMATVQVPLLPTSLQGCAVLRCSEWPTMDILQYHNCWKCHC